MKARLNITIEEGILEEIKKYSNRNNISISELVEKYFKRIVDKPKKKSLLDKIKALPDPAISPDINYKKGYYEEKYR